MKVNRGELCAILSALRPGLAKREFIPQLCHFLFLGKEIVTYNDKICISHPFDFDTPFSVKGEEFYRILEGIEDEEIIISVEEKKIKVRSKSTSATMKIISEDMSTLPGSVAIIEKGRHGWKSLPKDFSEGISLCSFAVSPDLSKGIAACVWVLKDTCYAIDSSRSSRFKMSSSIPDDLYIVGKEAAELVKFPIVEYCTDEKWGHFKTEDGVVFSCMLMRGTYPMDKVNKVYESFDNIVPIQFPKELKAITDGIIVLAENIENTKGRRVDLSLKDDEILVTASSELGEVTKSVPCKYSGSPIKVGINARFLSQILGRATSFYFNGTLIHFSNGPFQHIIAQTKSK